MIKCPQCQKVNTLEDWQPRYVACEMCGGHVIWQCPECGLELAQDHERLN